jgi:ABC-type nitrate/sulfonate/bicarbonate transport system substrate-binding protein
MKRKLLALVLTAVLASMTVAGCSSKSSDTGTKTTDEVTSSNTAANGETKPSGEKLVVGTMPLTVGVPVQYAYDNGFYEEEGLDVEIVIFSTGSPINEAFAAGQLDVAASGLASVYSLANGTASWIGEINTTGGMGIYVRPDSEIAKTKGQVTDNPNIYGSADLVKGLKILGPLGTTAQFNAICYADKFGLSSTDIELVHMEYGAAYSAFETGQGDAIALNPPFSFQAEDAGYISAGTFEDTTGVSLLDGVFVDNKVLSERREDIVRFIRATYKACDALQDDEVRYEYSMKWFNQNGKEYDEATLRSEMEARKYMTAESMTAGDYVYGEGMSDIAEFFTGDGKILEENLPNVVKSYDVSVLKDALNIDVTVDKE